MLGTSEANSLQIVRQPGTQAAERLTGIADYSDDEEIGQEDYASRFRHTCIGGNLPEDPVPDLRALLEEDQDPIETSPKTSRRTGLGQSTTGQTGPVAAWKSIVIAAA